MLERLRAHNFDSRVNRRNLSFFYAAAVEENFTRAAKICGVAQPSLSRGITQLEDAIGTVLFERTGRSVEVTERAKEILPEVELYPNQSMSFVEHLTSRNRGEPTELRIAAISTLTADLLPEIVTRFEASHLGVAVALIDGINQEIVDSVNVGHADIGIVATPEDPARFRTKLLFTDRYYLVVNLDHRMAGRTSVRWEELANERIATFRKGSSTFDTIRSNLNVIGIHFDPVSQVNYRNTLMGMVEHRGVATILPRTAIQRRDEEVIRTIPLIDPMVERSYYQVMRKGRLGTRVADAFGSYLQSQLMSLDYGTGSLSQDH